MVRNQLYEEKWGKHKDVNIKQHATKKPLVQWRNQRGNHKKPKTNTNDNTTLQKYGIQQN